MVRQNRLPIGRNRGIVGSTTVAVKTDLKQFRADLARLKKEGLVPPANRQGKKLNIKTARPTDLIQGKRLIDYVRDPKNRDVLEGNAVTLPASKVKDSEGFTKRKIKGGKDRVIVPLPADAKVSTEKGRIKITHESPTGSITRVQVPRKNLRQYLLNAEQLPSLKSGEVYSFYIYGHKSFMVSENADQLVEYIQHYKTLEDGDAEDAVDFFKHLEIVRLTKSARTGWESEVNERVRKSRRGGKHSAASRRIGNLPQYKQPIVRARRRESQRRYRASKRI